MPGREPTPILSRTAAVAMGVITLALRWLSLRNLPNDHYMHLVWANEILAGQVPGRDFVDPGMPLMYGLSAVVQRVWPTPFADAMLWIVLLAIATGAACLVTARLTGSTVVGILAACIALALEPRLYSVPKILVLAIGLLLLWHYAAAPRTRGLVGLAVWTAIAGLLRHDLGAFNALGVLTALAVLHGSDRRALGRAAGIYLGALVVAVLPYAVFVQLSEGLFEHLRAGVEMSKTNAHQLLPGLPEFPHFAEPGHAWTRIDSAAALFSAARILPVICLGVLIWHRRRVAPPVRATVAAACVTLAAYGAFILRHPVQGRVQDVAALLPLVAAWTLVRLGGCRPRVVWSSAGMLVFAAGLLAAGHLSDSLERLDDAQVFKGFEKMRLRAAASAREGSVWPWDHFWSQGNFPPIIQYLGACTRPTDRVLIPWFAPDYHYFSRRLMAGGLNVFFPGRAFSSDADQRRIIERIERVRVPVVLTNSQRALLENMPLVAVFLTQHYRPAGTFTIYDDSVVTIGVRRSLRATGTYGPDQWPCGFEG